MPFAVGEICEVQYGSRVFRIVRTATGVVKINASGRSQRVARIFNADELEAHGWLEDLVRGTCELFAHPTTLVKHLVTEQRDKSVLHIPYYTHLHLDGVAAIMESSLTLAEKSASTASLTSSNLPLRGEALKSLIDRVPRLGSREQGSIGWGVAYNSYLLPLGSTGRTSLPLMDSSSVNLGRGEWFAHYAAAWAHSEDSNWDHTFEQARKSQAILPAVTPLRVQDAIRFDRNLALTINHRGLDSLNPLQFGRLHTILLSPERARWKRWFCKRLSEGASMAVEAGQRSDWKMEEAEYFLTKEQLFRLQDERKHYPVTQAVLRGSTGLHYAGLLQTYYVLYAELGIEGAEEALGAMGGSREGWDLSTHLAHFLSRRGRYRKILRLFDEPYSSMPIPFALDLIDLGNAKNSRA